MRKGKLLVSVVSILVLSLVALPLVFGCAEKPAVPGKEKYVSLLSLSDYSGPIATITSGGDMGATIYMEYVNAQGGFDGIKMKWIGVDTRYDTARGISAYRRYRTDPTILVVIPQGTPMVEALWPLIQADGKVLSLPGTGKYAVRTNGDWLVPGKAYIYAPPYQDMFGAIVDWVVKDWLAKGKSGMPVLGYYNWDNEYGHESLLGGKEYAEKVGIKLLPPEFFPVGAVEHTVPLTRLAEAGANYIFAGGVDPTPAVTIKSAFDLGLTKKIQFIVDYWGLFDHVGGKLYPDAVEGAVITSCYLRGDEGRDNPWCKKLRDFKGIPSSEWTDCITAGVGTTGMHFASGIEAAVKMGMSYEKILVGDNFLKALSKSRDYREEGVTGPFVFSETNRRTLDSVRFYQYKNGKEVPITDWMPCPDTVSLHSFR
ncbi:MAG: hypothetical protein FJ006_03955 [Chloroflexi bacterium]|nr:hypothetical protein [Chloroflexota bacterium]